MSYFSSISFGLRTGKRVGKSILSVVLSVFLACSIIYLTIAGSLALTSSHMPYIRPIPFLQSLASSPPSFQATWDDITDMFDYSDADFSASISQVLPGTLTFLHNASSVVAFLPALITYPFDYMRWIIDANKTTVYAFPFEVVTDCDQMFLLHYDSSSYYYVILRPVILLEDYDGHDFPIGSTGSGSLVDPFVGYIFYNTAFFGSSPPDTVGNSLVRLYIPDSTGSGDFPLAQFEMIEG